MFYVELKNVVLPKGEHGPSRPSPKRTRVDGEFPSRQAARNWCRNHYYKSLHQGMVIIQPDGTEEDFQWNGLTNS